MTLSSLSARFVRRIETDSVFSASVAAIYTAILVFGHMHHVLWRDELHCWMVGRDASGFWDLVTGDRRYDGHPFLWYYVLHLASRVVDSYKAMHVIAVAAAGAAAFVWLRTGGFARYLKVMLLGTYYVAFEYTVLSRSYALEVLFLFLFCALYHPLRVRYLRLSALLVLIAATSAYGTIIACSLAAFLFLGPLASVRLEPSYPRQIKVTVPPAWFAGALVFLSGLVFIVVTTLPPHDAWFATGTNLRFDSESLRVAFEQYWLGMIPIPDWRLVEFWNTNAFLSGASAHARLLVAWASMSLLVAWLVALRRRPAIALSYLLGVAAMLLFQHVKFAGGTRHFGHCFLLLVACVWLYVREERIAPLPRWLTGLFVAHMSAQIVGAWIALGHSYAHPFSGALEAADLIKARGLADSPIVAVNDGPVSGVAGYLGGKKFFYPQTNEVADYVVWNNRRRTVGVKEILESAKEYAGTTGKSPLILLDFDLGKTTIPGMTTELILRTERPIVDDERIFIYRTRVQ